MLIYSSTTPTIHHDLLFLVYRKASFSSWQIVFAGYWVKINPWYLDKYVIACNVKLQILQVVVYVIYQYVYALVTPAPYVEMFVPEV